jgi:diadenosine tetraphosphatase ApaH/serine/threonine PP2A family protein phosphatase
VRRVLALPGHCVAGNHDLMVLDRLSDERCVPLARTSLRWTRAALDPDVRALLAGLPLGASDGAVAVRHGSVFDPQHYVLTREDALACLADIERVAPGTEILIVGHTHRPMAVGAHRGPLLRRRTGHVRLTPGEPTLLNPGAVGQSRDRDAVARVMVLDLAARVAEFHALPYDVEGCRRALRERRLPPESCHVPRSRWSEVIGPVKARARRLRAVR